MTLFGKAFKFVKSNVIPAAIAAASGNIGGAAAALLKKKDPSTSGASTSANQDKPNLVLGFESSAGFQKADFINDASDLRAAKKNSVLLYGLGAAVLGLGIYALGKKK